MADREFIYVVRDASAAIKAIEELDALPNDLLTGMGFFVQGVPEVLYVGANLEDPSNDDVTGVQQILDRAGTPAVGIASFLELMRRTPPPRVYAFGTSEVILRAIRKALPTT